VCGWLIYDKRDTDSGRIKETNLKRFDEGDDDDEGDFSVWWREAGKKVRQS